MESDYSCSCYCFLFLFVIYSSSLFFWFLTWFWLLRFFYLFLGPSSSWSIIVHDFLSGRACFLTCIHCGFFSQGRLQPLLELAVLVQPNLAASSRFPLVPCVCWRMSFFSSLILWSVPHLNERTLHFALLLGLLRALKSIRGAAWFERLSLLLTALVSTFCWPCCFLAWSLKATIVMICFDLVFHHYGRRFLTRFRFVVVVTVIALF